MSLGVARRIYQRPPIVEAVCEFRFGQVESWDLTIPGLLYEQIKTTFPTRRPWQSGLTVQLGPVPPPVVPDRIQFATQDERMLVQVAPNLLAINHLAPYSSWEYFRAAIGEVYSKYQTVDPGPAFDRVGLRYINRFAVPESRFDLEDYFNVVPKLPDVMPQEWAGFLVRVEVPYQADSSTLLFGLALAERDPQSKVPSFILDLNQSHDGIYMLVTSAAAGFTLALV